MTTVEVQEHHRFFQATKWGKSEPKVTPIPAPIKTFHVTPSLLQTHRSLAPTSVAAVPADASSHSSSMSAIGEEPQHARFTARQDPADLPSENVAPSAKDPEPTARTVSTLHIDGSALGQWAIQHLERSLGRPATGMTGVDPRSSLPRSRVAPF
jgi:hypothetical protein